MKRKIVLDFDGVLHSYNSGWKGVDCVPDPPVTGAAEALDRYTSQQDFEVHIFSSRSKDSAGIAAMKTFILKTLTDYDAERGEDIFSRIHWPMIKPAAWLSIDDRALTFEGQFPSVYKIRNFAPWNKRHDSIPCPPDDAVADIIERAAVEILSAKTFLLSSPSMSVVPLQKDANERIALLDQAIEALEKAMP